MKSKEQLEKLSTNRLLNILRITNIRLCNINTFYGHRCCETCNEWIGDNWYEEVGKYAEPYEIYKAQIKEILASREHVPRKTRTLTAKRIKVRLHSRGRGKYKNKHELALPRWKHY